jgi:CRISPR-associated protein (TIGR02584 family)
LPVTGLRDVDSYQTSEKYRDFIIKTVADLRQNNPDKQIALSLSGGRKGMSALTLFAAQGAGVSQVYHTTITDPDYEQVVLQETATDQLALLSREKLAQTLFLDKYDLAKFTLFEIPVISLASQ